MPPPSPRPDTGPDEAVVQLTDEPFVLGAVVLADADARALTERLAAEHAGTRFIGIVAAGDEAHLAIVVIGSSAAIDEARAALAPPPGDACERTP
ncbi:MAG: hypothetical protein ABW122_11020 [Ilumatobacteraceae bacterium]